MNTNLPVANKYLEKFESTKHRGYILVSDVQNVISIALTEFTISLSTPNNDNGKEAIEKMKARLEEYKRVFGLY